MHAARLSTCQQARACKFELVRVGMHGDYLRMRSHGTGTDTEHRYLAANCSSAAQSMMEARDAMAATNCSARCLLLEQSIPLHPCIQQQLAVCSACVQM
eukprot:1159783-Pelagomonas_calceolata.AAC.21